MAPNISKAALVIGALGVACLVVGSIWPWLTSPMGLIGTLPSPWLLWSTVVAAVATMAAIGRDARPRWLWSLVAVTIIAALAARSTADPGWMCWDGRDAAGNPVGDCGQDWWTPMPIVFAVGVALVVGAAVMARLARPRA